MKDIRVAVRWSMTGVWVIETTQDGMIILWSLFGRWLHSDHRRSDKPWFPHCVMVASATGNWTMQMETSEFEHLTDIAIDTLHEPDATVVELQWVVEFNDAVANWNLIHHGQPSTT